MASFPPIFGQSASGVGNPGSQLRYKIVNFPHASIISGGNVRIVPGRGGYIIRPIQWSSMKNFSVAYAPSNSSFSLRYGAAGAALTGTLTPQLTSIGRRYDSAAVVVGNQDPAVVGGADLNIFPNAGNGNGSAANVLQFMLVYVFDPVI